MTKKEYFELIDATFAEVRGIVEAKNADYTAQSDDPFANFRLSTLEGVQPEVGLMIRLQDKLQRIRSFMRSGTLSVANESADDAVNDIIGYCLILKGLMAERSDRGCDDCDCGCA